MERKPRIFPKELVHFPRKGLQNKTKSVLLPCPPHRISPLWEKTYKTRTEQVPHLSHQTKVTEISSVSPFLRDAKRLSSIAVPRKISMSSHLPHTDHKAMTTLLPCLHRGLAKTSPRHKYNAFTSVMPFPRSNCKVKKTALKFSDKQCLMPLPDYKNNPDYLLDLDQVSLDNSGPDHFPKIFPGYKNRTEAITNFDQKALAPIPDYIADVSLCEGDKIGSGLVCRSCLDSQTEATRKSLTTTQYTKTSLRNKQNQVRAASMMLGFNKKGNRPTPPNSSHYLKDWSSAKTVKPLDLIKMLEKSYSDPCPKNMVSLAGCTNPESRFLTSASSHHNQKSRVTVVTSPDHQGEHIQAATPQAKLSMDIEPWEEIALTRANGQTTAIADQDHEVTFLLNQDSSEDCTTSSSVFEAEDLQDPNIHFRLQAEQDQQGKMTEEIEHQALIPADHETTTPSLVLQDTSADQWVKLSPSQIKTTQCLVGHISVQTDQKFFAHASVQTEQESWQTMSSSIDHQATMLIGSDHGTTPRGLNPKMYNSGLNYCTTSTWIPDHEVTGNKDINTSVTVQARQDHLGKMEQEIDLDGAIFFTGQKHGPLELGPQDKILHGSNYQETIMTGQDPKIIPPMTLGSQKEILPESNPQATFLTNPYHFTKESQDHLVCFSVQKEYETSEIMSKTDQEEYGTASILGLDSKNILQDDLDQKTTSPSSPDHLAKDLPIVDVQIKCHGELGPCEEIALGTQHQTTLLIDQGPLATPPLNLAPQDTASDPWVTTPLDQDHGITVPLVSIPKNKVLTEPDQWSTILIRSHHQNQAIQDHIPEISLQINQEQWQKMPSQIDQQTTALTGQDHGVTKPLLVLATKDTLSPSLAHQSMSPLCSDHQAGHMSDPNVQFIVLGDQDSLGEMAQKIHHHTTTLADQNHGTISPGNLDPQDQILSASDPQTIIVRDQDHETILSSTLGPQNKILLKSENSVKPLPCPYLAGNPQDQMPQALLQTEQDLQEIIPAGTSYQTTKLKGQDQETITPFTFGPQRLEIDVELSTPPSPAHHQDKDTPNHVAEISVQTEHESVKMIPARLCHQDHHDYGTTPLVNLDPKATSATGLDLDQDYGTTPLVVLESKATSPTGLEYWATSQHNPNQQDKIIIDQNTQVTLQTSLNHWETITKEKDLILINVTDEDFLDLDNQETTQAGIDQVEDIQYPKAMTSPQPKQDHSESMLQGVEAKDKTFTSQAIPLLTLGLQDQTLPLPDHQTIPQTNPKYSVEDTSDSVIHVCPEMMVQEDLEIPSTVKNQQVAAPSDQEPETTPPLGLEEDKIKPDLYHLTCLPSPDHQSEDLPVSNVDASTQTEQGSWKTMPKRKDPQAKAQTDIDHKTTPLLGLDQNEALTGTRYQVIPSSSPYKQTEDAQSPITYISFQTDPVPWETILPIMDNQTTTLKAQNNKTILHKKAGFSYQDTNMLSTDQQAEHIQRLIAHVLLQMKRGYWETSPKIDRHQNTTVKGQENETILLLSLDSQDETLSQDTSKFILDQKMEPPQSSSAHISFQIEPKSRETMLPRIDHQVTSSMGWVNGSASSLNSVSWDRNQSGSDHQVIIDPINPYNIPEAVPDLQTHAIDPSNNYHLPKSLMNLNHKVMPKSIASLRTGQSKQNPWCFKPYTADRATITTEIIHTIIRSIPQERIRNDISKQIFLKRMKVSSALRSGQHIFSSYPVCLICASWIPDNCPHVQRMKYPCKAQLLAIPIPLPNSKEYMGVKFVLQIPQAKCFRFILPEIYYISQMSSCHSADSLPSSHLESVRSPVPSPAPERIKGLSSYIINKYHQPGERATFRSQQSPISTGYMKEYSSRADEPSGHPIFFRSLLERFQLKQKVN